MDGLVFSNMLHRPARTFVSIFGIAIGVLLIVSLLIIPAAAVRGLSRTPEQMAVLAAIVGAVSVVGGLFASLRWDTPSGPSIVVVATVLFVVGLGIGTARQRAGA